jgi:hypothetical protein
MSRSIRHTPIFGFAKCESEKKDKKIAHSTLRAHFRTEVASFRSRLGLEFDERNAAHSNKYDMGKDGKHWWGGLKAAPAANGKLKRRDGRPAQREDYLAMAK